MAWGVEGTLHRILSLFSYDWQAMMEYLRSVPTGSDRQESSQGRRPRRKAHSRLLEPGANNSGLPIHLLAE
jgi:hypothetical protein